MSDAAPHAPTDNVRIAVRAAETPLLARLRSGPARRVLDIAIDAADRPFLLGPLFEAFLLAAPASPVVQALRSRDPNLEISNVRGTPDEARKLEEILFSARGEVFVPAPDAVEEGDDLESESGAFEQPFTYELRTRFSRFHNGHILHRPGWFVSGPFGPHAASTTVEELCRMIPLRIRALQFEVDFFERRSFGALLGFAPFVVGHFSVRWTERKLGVRASGALNADEILSSPPKTLLSAACHALEQGVGANGLTARVIAALATR